MPLTVSPRGPPLEDRALGSRRELEDGLQTGGHTGHPDAGCPLGQRRDQLVAAAPVALPASSARGGRTRPMR